VLHKERELIGAQARNEGKPQQVIERIVAGRIESFFEERVLYDQKFIRPDRYDGTVGRWMEELTATLGENIGVTRFARLAVGEGAA
jgi:elongation factor Ts